MPCTALAALSVSGTTPKLMHCRTKLAGKKDIFVLLQLPCCSWSSEGDGMVMWSARPGCGACAGGGAAASASAPTVRRSRLRRTAAKTTCIYHNVVSMSHGEMSPTA